MFSSRSPGMDFANRVASVGKIWVRAGGKHLWVLSRTVFSRAKEVHSVVLIFKVHRAEMAQGAVQPLTVVEALDVIEDLASRLAAGGELSAVNQFQFEGAPEAFHGGVVVAVALAAHRGHQAGPAQCLTVLLAGVLDAPVGMDKQIGWRLAVQKGHAQGAKTKGGVNPSPLAQ